MMVIECALCIALPLSHVIADGRMHLPKTKREVITLLYTFPFALLTIIPSNQLQSMFGYADSLLHFLDLSEEHRLFTLSVAGDFCQRWSF